MDGTAERSDKPVGSGHRGTNFQKSFAPANQSVSSFDFIYDLVAPYYPANGRLFIAPVSMFKMLLVGYLYGIKSERRLIQEVQLNIAYRWFCGFGLGEKIPDHSTFSKTRVHKWNESGFF